MMSRCAIFELNTKRRAVAGLAFDRDRSAMIADDRLHNRQAESCTVLLGRVVRSEETLTFLGREAGAGIGDFEPYRAVRMRSPDRENAARRHGVERVQRQVLERAMELRGVSLGRGQPVVKLHSGGHV